MPRTIIRKYPLARINTSMSTTQPQVAPQVDDKHAEISIVGRKNFRLEALNKGSVTKINNEPIENSKLQLLEHNDVFTVGGTSSR